MKEDLLEWVDKRYELDLASKFILYKLAQYADAECCAWAKVATLSKHANCSERTVQNRLLMLREKGYLRDTGRTHRLEETRRSVPIYQLAPQVDGLGRKQRRDDDPAPIRPRATGANSAPIENLRVQESTPSGAAACTPYELKEPNESSNELSTQAREREAMFDQVERAYPRAGLGVSDRSMAWRAFLDLVAAGVDMGQLVEAAGRYAADPMLRKRDFGPVSLQRWLAEGRYRGWLAQDDEPRQSAAPRSAFAGPAELRAAVAQAKGETFAASYVDRSGWDDQAKAIVPWSSTAAERLRGAAAIISEFGASIGTPQARGRA